MTRVMQGRLPEYERLGYRWVAHDLRDILATVTEADATEQYAEEQNLCPTCLTQQPCPAHYRSTR